jgi:pimeloyl-ACP methyl ester carboxylesterase
MGLVVVTLIAACTADPGVEVFTSVITVTTEASASAQPAVTQPGDEGEQDVAIEWETGSDGVDIGTIEVPLDWSDATGETIAIHLARHRAADPSQRIGTLLVNPGGPGAAGSSFGEFAESIYTERLVDRFDIIGWDPRGTGESEPPVMCDDAFDPYFAIDSSPDTADERALLVERSQQFATRCAELTGGALAFVDTVSTARDMDAIRRALGEDRISYFGFSYGSELGAVWATMFPDTVRAAVLDGAVDPTQPYFEQNISQAAGFEQALSTLLARCSADRSCPFHNDGDAEAAFDRLAAYVDADPIGGERTPITQGVLATAVATSLYDEALWYRLEVALADAQAGDGAGLLELYDEYYDLDAQGRHVSGVTDAYFAIGCVDDPGTTSPDELFGRAGELAEAAPRMGPAYQMELMVCAVWPHRPRATVTITGVGAGPIVVVGTTGDTATPFTSTAAMASTLEDGHLITVVADQHTGYGANTCVDEAVDGYLIDPANLPADGLRCE